MIAVNIQIVINLIIAISVDFGKISVIILERSIVRRGRRKGNNNLGAGKVYKMKKSAQHLKSKKINPILCLLLIAIIILCISVWIVFFRQDTSTFIQGNSVSQESAVIEKNEDSISIPGYEGITLRANSLKQDVALKNPPQNTCYFMIALYLDNGTLLWESDYIEPGGNSSPIVLTQELSKGTYPNAVLKYSCFKMDKEKTPLNGAETKLTLRAK